MKIARTISIDKEVWRRYKSKCALENTNVSAGITALLKKNLKEDL